MPIPIITTDPPETIEWLLRQCREAFNAIKNQRAHDGHSTYDLAAKLDRLLEPRVVVCQLSATSAHRSVGIGHTPEAAQADAETRYSHLYGHDAGADCRISFDIHVLRARDPAREVPKAE